MRQGQTVRLHGLTRYNWAVGRLRTFDAATGRWEVRLRVDGAGVEANNRLALRPRNLYKYPVLQQGDRGYETMARGTALRNSTIASMLQQQVPRDEIAEAISPLIVHVLPAAQAPEFYAVAAQLFITTLLYSQIEGEVYREWARKDLATEEQARVWRPPCFGGEIQDIIDIRAHNAAQTRIARAMTHSELLEMRVDTSNGMANVPTDFV